MQELEALARRQGWRLDWRVSTWNTMGWKLRVLDIYEGAKRVGGGACTFDGSDIQNFSSETIASMIIEALSGRASGGRRSKAT